MTSNLKALGLALLAVFAMGAIAASAAQAETGFFTLAQEGKLHATREQLVSEPTEFLEFPGSPAFKLVCEVAHYTSGIVPVSNQTLTVTPNYTDHTEGSSCRPFGLVNGNFTNVTVTENGCNYVL